jgi:predicted aspartyl protease
MSLHKFQILDEDSLIIVKGLLGADRISLALDTGASHTVIDLSTMLLAGYDLKDAIKIVELETGKGNIDAYVFKVNKFKSLDITRAEMEICSYDFLANNLLLEIHGVLGLDFFKNTDLFISFKKFEITVNE